MTGPRRRRGRRGH